MAEKYDVIQCKLQQGDHVYVAFIPSQFAIKGKHICIDELEGIWTVMEVYSSSRTSISEANEHSQDYKKHRKFSDA